MLSGWPAGQWHEVRPNSRLYWHQGLCVSSECRVQIGIATWTLRPGDWIVYYVSHGPGTFRAGAKVQIDVVRQADFDKLYNVGVKMDGPSGAAAKKPLLIEPVKGATVVLNV